MQSNFFRYHFGLEWEKRKIVRRVHAKRILQTAPHTYLQVLTRNNQNTVNLLDGVMDERDTLLIYCFEELLVGGSGFGRLYPS